MVCYMVCEQLAIGFLVLAVVGSGSSLSSSGLAALDSMVLVSVSTVGWSGQTWQRCKEKKKKQKIKEKCFL